MTDELKKTTPQEEEDDVGHPPDYEKEEVDEIPQVEKEVKETDE